MGSREDSIRIAFFPALYDEGIVLTSVSDVSAEEDRNLKTSPLERIAISRSEAMLAHRRRRASGY
jgi:hypothetical protein